MKYLCFTLSGRNCTVKYLRMIFFHISLCFYRFWGCLMTHITLLSRIHTTIRVKILYCALLFTNTLMRKPQHKVLSSNVTAVRL